MFIHWPDPVPQQPKGWCWNLVPLGFEYLGAPIVRLWGRTWDLEINGLDNLRKARKSDSFIVALWHGQISVLIYTLRDLGMYSLVSPVWEGELIARVMKGLGHKLTRGSDGFHAVQGTRSSIKHLKAGNSLAMALDGPEGPRHEVKPGTIAMAALSGKPILPVISVAKHYKSFPSWDITEVPYPFSKVTFNFGEPIYIPKKLTAKMREDATENLKQSMIDLEIKAHKELDPSWVYK